MLIGAAVGALAAGRIADKVGRRPTVLGTAVLFVAGVLLAAFSPSYGVLVVARIVIGLAVGSASMVVPLYIGEVAPPRSHDKGLLPEPDRDPSGYRRYTAQDAVELIRIRTLAEAGVPLARIRDLTVASGEAFRLALTQIDEGLTARVRSLQATQLRLRELASGHTRLLLTAVDHHLQRLVGLGFTQRWVAMEHDLWILVFATHPELASQLFDDQAQALTDPALRQLYLDYDRAHDLDPHDPFLADLARRIVRATAQRYGTGDLPGQVTGSEIP